MILIFSKIISSAYSPKIVCYIIHYYIMKDYAAENFYQLDNFILGDSIFFHQNLS